MFALLTFIVPLHTIFLYGRKNIFSTLHVNHSHSHWART
uniref:Uncharacterized protein n=1 Tax=Anguilla anguilla TaxID=7936 RepID=A0A0E9QC89_ANGAN